MASYTARSASQGSREDTRSTHTHSKESRNHSQHPQRSVSNTETIDSQHGSDLALSSTRRQSSTALSSYTRNYTTKTLYSKIAGEPEGTTHDYTLMGISAQFADTYEYQVPTQTIINLRTTRRQYHDPVLDSHGHHQDMVPHESDILNLYLSAGPSEQYAVYHRPDTGTLSTQRGFLCHLAGKESKDV